MTQPINPNPFILAIDTEVSGLPTDFYATRRLGDPIDLNMDKIMKSFGAVDIFQVGFIANGSRQHIDVTNAKLGTQDNLSFVMKKDHSYVGPDGKKGIYKKGGTVTSTRNGITDFIRGKHSKLSSKLADKYERDALPSLLKRSMQETAVLDNGSVIQSMPMKLRNKSYEETAKIANDNGFFHKKINQATFISKRDDSLYSIIDNLLAHGSKNSPAEFRAWNPQFDASVILATLQKSGHKDLVDKFINQYKTGLLNIQGIEDSWHKVLWKLIKENPDIATTPKIGMHPIAAAATGRPGATANTFEEFRHSTYSWKQDKLAKWFNLKNIDHIASTDILSSVTFDDIMQGVIKKAESESGMTFAQLFDNPNTGDLFTRALNSSMNTMHNNNNTGTARRLLGEIADDAAATHTFHRRNFASWFGSDITTRSRAKWSKYPGIIGAALVIAGATFFGRGDEKVSISDGSVGKSGKNSKIGRGVTADMDTDSPYIGTGVAKAMFAGIVVPGITMAAVGYGAAQRHPMLGFNPQKPTTFKELYKQGLSTIRYGIKTVEGQFPLARVFGMGAISDYVLGSRSYWADADGNGIGRTLSGKKRPGRWLAAESYLDDKGKVVNKNKLIMTDLLKDIRKADEELFHAIVNGLDPSDIGKDDGGKVVVRKQVRFANTTGRNTIVQVTEDHTINGIYHKGTPFSRTIAIDAALMKMRDRPPQSARLANRTVVNPSNGKVSRIQGPHVTSSIAHEIAAGQLYKSGKYVKPDYNDYMKSLDMPGFASSSEMGNKAWRGMEFVRHLLDLNAKGVGEKSNVFYPGLSQELGRATHVLSNRTVGAYAKGAGDYLFGNMDKFLESPFEFLGVNTEKFTGFANRLKASNYITSNIAGKVMSAIERPHLGLGYARYGNPAKYMGAFAAKRVLPAMIAYNAFGLVDHALGAATMSPTGRGPFTEIPIKAFEAASLAYTKLSDITGLTDWAKWQDRVAPGSTGIGIMAPAATATGLYFMGEKMYQHGPDFIGGTIDKAGRKMLQHPLMRAAARPEAYKGALARGPVENLLSYVIKNPKKGIFGLAMLPSIPFLPGFFGSDKNYAEKKAEYKGEKEVAIRKYRGWLLSSSPFEGGRVRSWRRHSLNLIESDFENRGVVYPSFTDRFMHNASLGMYKPNILEDYHGDAQPVYKSSPWGTNVPLVGPIIAGTIGKLIGTKTYHTPGEYAPREVQEYAGDGANHDQESGLSRSVEMGTVKKLFGDDQNKTGYMIGLQDPSSLNSLASRFADSLGDLSGFRGFSLQTTYEKMAGKNLPDKYTPYAQDSSQMYSPAEQMWQYNLGDITVVGGEFMRRILQNSEKKWEVNDIPNELFGVSWIPQADDQRGTTKDLTHGTTFNKVDMGWLYGSRKGWEFLYPGEAKGDMESYSAPLKTEILQQLAPYSAKFNEAAKETYGQAIGGQLSPKQEQRFYETLDQVSQVKQQLYATAGEYSFALDTEAESGIVDTVQDDGSFSMKGKNYRLAGVSLHEADIRARLLQKNEYNSAQALADDVASIRERTAQIISKHLGPGREVSFNKATATMLPSETESGIEVQIDSLTEELWSAGAPFANTGNLASHNIAQDRDGIMSRVSAAYWDGLTATNSYWNKKLISKRDYLDNYTTNQVYNREVKLWTRPIEHIVKPFLASTVHNLTGIDFIPSFTKERRANQQYWDVVKYIKYKMLSGRAKDEGDMESAAFFESQWRSTMIGADPTDSSMKDVLNALPVNERQYFNNFANEPDPEKRKEIFGYLPEQAKRLYSSIWMRKAAAASNDQQLLANWSKLQESEGWDLSEDEEAEYANETGGRASKADWARAKYVQSYAQKRNLPGAEWSGWNESVDINNVQLLALQEDGENVQDYGFFDSNIRQAIYDDYAYAAATSYESMSVSANVIMGDITPMLMEDSVMSAYATPTSSMSPIREVNIETNGFARILDKLNNFGSEILDDYFTDPY